jgi:hypothetical protein
LRPPRIEVPSLWYPLALCSGLFHTTSRFAGLTFGVRANATAQTLLPFVESEISDTTYSAKYELDVRVDGPGYQGALAVVFTVKAK